MRSLFALLAGPGGAALLAVSSAGAAPLSSQAQQQVASALADRTGPMKVRLQAAMILGHGGGPEVVPALLDALGDPDFPVRAAAALALGNVGDARASAPLASRLEDPEPFVREEAAEGLLHLLARHADPALPAAFKQLDAGVRAKLLGVLGGAEPALAAPVAAVALADPDPAVAEALHALLARWTPPEVQRFLLELLHDRRPTVRAAAALALGQRRVSLSIPALQEMLLSPEETPETVSAARHALRALAEELDLVQLREVARSGEGPVRLRAMATLAAVRDPEAFDVLSRALESPTLAVRAAAAVDLGVLGDARATQPLAVLAGRAENAPIQLTLQSAMRAVEAGGER